MHRLTGLAGPPARSLLRRAAIGLAVSLIVLDLRGLLLSMPDERLMVAVASLGLTAAIDWRMRPIVRELPFAIELNILGSLVGLFLIGPAVLVPALVWRLVFEVESFDARGLFAALRRQFWLLVWAVGLLVLPPAAAAVTLLVISVTIREGRHSLIRLARGRRGGAAGRALVSEGVLVLFGAVHEIATVLLIVNMTERYGVVGLLLTAGPIALLLIGGPRILSRAEQALLAADAEREAMRLMLGELEGRRLKADEAAFRDPLTGLLNRAAFERDVAEVRDPALLVLGDVSGLKQVNSALGHAGGDLLLRAVGAGLQRVIRGSDTAYRFVGGDEYAIIMPAAEASFAAAIVARLDAAVRAAIAAEPRLAGRPGHLRFGAAHTAEATTTAALRALADARLTEAWEHEHQAGLTRGE